MPGRQSRKQGVRRTKRRWARRWPADLLVAVCATGAVVLAISVAVQSLRSNAPSKASQSPTTQSHFPAQSPAQIPSTTIAPTRPSPSETLQPVTAVNGSVIAVHLTDFTDRTTAEIGWRLLRSRYSKALLGLKPLYEERKTVSGAKRVRLMAGPFQDRQDAVRKCRDLIKYAIKCTPAVFSEQLSP